MVTDIEQQAVELRRRAIEEPDWWIEHILGCALTAFERELVKLVATSPRVTVRSCTASGKTFTAGRLVLWFLNNHKPSIVLTTAKTFRQVEIEIWKEIWTAYKASKFPLGGRLLATRLEMDKDWFALGFSTDDAENVLGVHSKHILIIIDEAPGIPDEVYKAIETPMSTGNAKVVVLGNPMQPIGEYRNTFDSPLYKQFHISAFDTPNFISFNITLDDIKSGEWKDKVGIAQWQIEDGSWLDKMPCPYLINPLWVTERLGEWGEGSFSFQVYVLGNFPEKGAQNLFNLPELEAAVDRLEVDDEGDTVSALDVARYGDCESVYGIRRGDKVLKLEVWGHQGIHYNTGRTAMHLREDSPHVCRIDAGGIGADDCDILDKEGFNIDRVMSNSPAVDKERFLNRRAELYWLLSKRFTDEKISIPNDRKLIGQLADIRYTYKNGKLAMETKEEMRARGSKSPDRADMLAMLFTPGPLRFADKQPVWRW